MKNAGSSLLRKLGVTRRKKHLESPDDEESHHNDQNSHKNNKPPPTKQSKPTVPRQSHSRPGTRTRTRPRSHSHDSDVSRNSWGSEKDKYRQLKELKRKVSNKLQKIDTKSAVIATVDGGPPTKSIQIANNSSNNHVDNGFADGESRRSPGMEALHDVNDVISNRPNDPTNPNAVVVAESGILNPLTASPSKKQQQVGDGLSESFRFFCEHDMGLDLQQYSSDDIYHPHDPHDDKEEVSFFTEEEEEEVDDEDDDDVTFFTRDGLDDDDKLQVSSKPRRSGFHILSVVFRTLLATSILCLSALTLYTTLMMMYRPNGIQIKWKFLSKYIPYVNEFYHDFLVPHIAQGRLYTCYVCGFYLSFLLLFNCTSKERQRAKELQEQRDTLLAQTAELQERLNYLTELVKRKREAEDKLSAIAAGTPNSLASLVFKTKLIKPLREQLRTRLHEEIIFRIFKSLVVSSHRTEDELVLNSIGVEVMIGKLQSIEYVQFHPGVFRECLRRNDFSIRGIMKIIRQLMDPTRTNIVPSNNNNDQQRVFVLPFGL